jgi:hypothetical protein
MVGRYSGYGLKVLISEAKKDFGKEQVGLVVGWSHVRAKTEISRDFQLQSKEERKSLLSSNSLLVLSH